MTRRKKRVGDVLLFDLIALEMIRAAFALGAPAPPAKALAAAMGCLVNQVPDAIRRLTHARLLRRKQKWSRPKPAQGSASAFARRKTLRLRRMVRVAQIAAKRRATSARA